MRRSDLMVRIQDDFYEAINGEWEKKVGNSI